jgi:multidrug efflux pump subunit AcrB
VPALTAVVEATVRRSRPVVLTAAAAVLAMVPLAGSVFWGPMAIAIMGGLVVATVLTLLVVPAMYSAWLGGRYRQAERWRWARFSASPK